MTLTSRLLPVVSTVAMVAAAALFRVATAEAEEQQTCIKPVAALPCVCTATSDGQQICYLWYPFVA